MAEFDVRLNSYISGAVAESQRPILREALLEEARSLELHQDLGYSREGDVEESFFIELHNWLADLKASMVRDGLHIFGQPPMEERMEASITYAAPLAARIGDDLVGWSGSILWLYRGVFINGARC